MLVHAYGYQFSSNQRRGSRRCILTRTFGLRILILESGLSVIDRVSRQSDIQSLFTVPTGSVLPPNPEPIECFVLPICTVEVIISFCGLSSRTSFNSLPPLFSSFLRSFPKVSHFPSLSMVDIKRCSKHVRHYDSLGRMQTLKIKSMSTPTRLEMLHENEMWIKYRLRV